MPAHKHCDLFLPTSGFRLKLGWQESETVSWILRDSSNAHHSLSPVMILGIRHTKKEKKKAIKLCVRYPRKKEKKVKWGTMRFWVL